MNERYSVRQNETTFLYEVVSGSGHVAQSFKFHPDAESLKDSLNDSAKKD